PDRDPGRDHPEVVLAFQLEKHRHDENRDDPGRDAQKKPTIDLPKSVEAERREDRTDPQEFLPEVAADAGHAGSLQTEVRRVAREARTARVLPETVPRPRIAELQRGAARVLEQRQQMDR